MIPGGHLSDGSCHLLSGRKGRPECLFAFAVIQMPLTQNNQYVKLVYFGMV
jgi:hypothetical protein